MERKPTTERIMKPVNTVSTTTTPLLPIIFSLLWMVAIIIIIITGIVAVFVSELITSSVASLWLLLLSTSSSSCSSSSDDSVQFPHSASCRDEILHEVSGGIPLDLEHEMVSIRDQTPLCWGQGTILCLPG